MEIRVLVWTLFAVVLFVNTAHPSFSNLYRQRSHNLSVGMDDLDRPRIGYGWKQLAREIQWYQKIAGAFKDSLLESTDAYPQEAAHAARVLVDDPDYAGDYGAVANNNTLTSPPPPGVRRRRLLQIYPDANATASIRHKGRKLLQDYAEAAANPIFIH